jgi:flagellar hook-associated protein 2
MSRISSSVGLITGIPIEDTVKKLMEVASQPRTLLANRTTGLKQQQAALDTLGSRLLAFQFSVNKLKSESVYAAREATSSNEAALDVKVPATGKATVGSFLVRPVRAASAQQVLSQQFSSVEEALAGGSLTFRVGGFVDQGISLGELNGGAGVQRGKVRITDRSGASATVDLSFARTVADVVDAINANADVAVSASTNGDSFVLTDNSGGSGNLRVQEVGNGTTAAGLGLATVNAASSEVTGANVLRLHVGTKLATLNDGNGIAISGEGVTDIEVDLADGTHVSIDLAGSTTVGDVITKIGGAASTKLSASISSDGRRIELRDLTTGGGAFKAANGVASTAADDLGLIAEVDGDAISGDRLIAGLKDTLLSSLNGGKGLTALGTINITDRNGGAATVNLAAAETLGDVINLINASSANVTASINAARNGIAITDASGGSDALIVANADGSKSATQLGLVVNDAVSAVNSGTLRRQTISRGTQLSSLNGGAGVSLGDIRITDSDGVTKVADLNTFGDEAKTVGDVIDAINGLTNGVEARINDAGDGILLVDTAQGSSTFGVQDVAGNIAESLNLTRASKAIDIDGTPTQAVDGSFTYSVDLDDLDVSSTSVSLASLNNGAGVAAGAFVITDSKGGPKGVPIDLKGIDSGIKTVGQLVDAINSKAQATGVGVKASINDAGTGILLEDTAGGTGTLEVRDVNSTTASNLKIVGKAKTVGGKQIIDGAGTFSATTGAQNGLEALASHINGLKAGVTASTVFDGVAYRLSLSVNAAGDGNNLVIDTGDTGLQFEEVSKAQDALLLYGNFSNAGGGVLLNSRDGTFAGAVAGVDITVKTASDTPVTVNVNQTNTTFVESIEDLVASYNSLRTDLGKLTAFDSEAATTGLLFGTNEALQIDSRLSRALTDRYFGLGSYQTLEQLGLSVADDGKLELNSTKLQAAFEKDPAGVEEFFTNAQSGVAKKVSDVVDRLAGSDDSLLASRSDALQGILAANETRLTRYDEQLERQQERLLLQFYQLESIIAKMQSNLTAVQNLQRIAPLSA